MRHLFIINPAAGSYNQTEDYRKKIAEICEAKGLDYSIRVSGAPGRCCKIAREAAQSGEEYRIYACGGDGTLNEVVGGVAGYDNVAITVYSGGSGNDFVKLFDDPKAFFELERLLDAEAIDTLVDAYMREKGWVNSADDKYYDEHLSIATADVQKYTTSTSPDWALHRMGTKTIAVLTDESEACIQRLFDRSLCWSKSFSKALSQTAFGESSLLWRDVVYTRAFSRTDIERWACDTHNSILKTSAKIVCDTPELLDFVLEEIHPANKMKKAVVQRKKVH